MEGEQEQTQEQQGPQLSVMGMLTSIPEGYEVEKVLRGIMTDRAYLILRGRDGTHALYAGKGNNLLEATVTSDIKDAFGNRIISCSLEEEQKNLGVVLRQDGEEWRARYPDFSEALKSMEYSL